VLRIVEREGQWVEASVTNWTVAVQEHKYGPLKGVEMPEPAVTDQATIAAHLAAFGSANVRSLHQAWRSAITAIETEEAALRWKVNDDYPGPRSIRDLNGSPEVLQPEELAVRQALADAIAEELGHR
jgi:hypothetical protein